MDLTLKLPTSNHNRSDPKTNRSTEAILKIGLNRRQLTIATRTRDRFRQHRIDRNPREVSVGTALLGTKIEALRFSTNPEKKKKRQTQAQTRSSHDPSLFRKQEDNDDHYGRNSTTEKPASTSFEPNTTPADDDKTE